MNVLLVYAHPEPTSFTAALKDAAVETLTAAGHSVEVSDLYAEHFNPVENDADFAVFVERLAAFRGKREFFNSHVELKLG